MELINHYDNGVNGLRIAATVCVVLGCIAFIIGLLEGMFDKAFIFIAPFLAGCVSLGIMYLTACFIRVVATIGEAAQAYLDKNETEEYEENE